METKICPSCGNEIDAQTTYCNYCGAAQRPNVRTEAYPPEPTPQQWPRQNEPMMQQPEYMPQAPIYAPQSPMFYAQEGGGLGWIVFLRVILWIVFAAVIAYYTYIGIQLIDYYAETEGILTIAFGVLLGFIIIAGGMVALNNASNHRKTANNTAKILQILQMQNRK